MLEIFSLKHFAETKDTGPRHFLPLSRGERIELAVTSSRVNDQAIMVVTRSRGKKKKRVKRVRWNNDMDIFENRGIGKRRINLELMKCSSNEALFRDIFITRRTRGYAVKRRTILENAR